MCRVLIFVAGFSLLLLPVALAPLLELSLALPSLFPAFFGAIEAGSQISIEHHLYEVSRPARPPRSRGDALDSIWPS